MASAAGAAKLDLSEFVQIFESPLVKALIELAIAEDLSFGDPTSALLESDRQICAELIAKQELLVCGLALTKKIAESAGKSIEVKNLVSDGDLVAKGTAIQKIFGKSSDIVSIERIILNFIQRLSGVATHTHNIVQKAHEITVLDTRKTTPGFRILEKYATRVGGAKNHRMHLGEMIMIKNNHIDAAVGDSLEQKFENLMNVIKNKAAFYSPYEIEVRNLKELEIALNYKPIFILLDNLNDSDIKACLEKVELKSPSTICEISGGIDQNRFEALSMLGVKLVSMGALTTKAVNVDISLKITI